MPRSETPRFTPKLSVMHLPPTRFTWQRLTQKQTGQSARMQWALNDAGFLTRSAYINAHGTSTPSMIYRDKGNQTSIRRACVPNPNQFNQINARSCHGRIRCAWRSCLRPGDPTWLVPPTINYEEPDPECDLDYVPNQARQQEIQPGMSNSFGLGGQNACLVVQNPIAQDEFKNLYTRSTIT